MAPTLVCRSCLQRLAHQASRTSRSHSRTSVSAPLLQQLPRYQHTRAAPTSRLPSHPVPRPRYYATAPPPPTADAGLSQQPPRAGPGPHEHHEADFTETYVAFSGTEALFKECARQADYTVTQAFERKGEIPTTETGEHIGSGTGWWYETLGLTPTFNTWAQVTMLHMYILTARLRTFPPSYAGIWQQHLTDHFFYEAEHRMTIFHQLSSRMQRNRYLKELYDQWRGVTGAYDEGLIRGDAMLAAAVWRNVFGARPGVDWEHVAAVVGFVRRGLRGLERAEERRITGGLIKFGSPESEEALVEGEAVEMKESFGPEDEEAYQKFKQEVQAAGQKART